MEPNSDIIETAEQKIEHLQKERDEKILAKKYRDEEFYLEENGNLSRYGWGKNILYVGMPVKVKKPDSAWRKGLIDYIKLEDTSVGKRPKIGVICGKDKLHFEKSWGEVVEDKTIEKIVQWETIEVPERLKKMSTYNLLREYRRIRRSIRNTDEEYFYTKELYFREHVGETNVKTQRRLRQNAAKRARKTLKIRKKISENNTSRGKRKR